MHLNPLPFSTVRKSVLGVNASDNESSPVMKSGDMSRKLAILIASAAIIAIFLAKDAGSVHLNLASDGTGARASEAIVVPNRAVLPTEELRYARSLSGAFRAVAKELAPSVVAISTVHRPQLPYQQGLGIGPFGPPRPLGPIPERHGKGSGVILSEDGLIATNCHVVRGADEITVRLADRREFPASIVGLDPDSDLAVLQIQASGLTPATLAESDSIEIGEWVLALGNPFGLEQTVTAGIISAKGRSGMGLATYENFLQTDAAINPGNSGGPLVDLDGRVVGINTAISSPDGVNHGIGFAIPASMVRRVTAELIERGRVTRGWLGVTVAPAMNGTRVRPGAALSFVAPDTPAWSAGLRSGDVIVKLDDQSLETPSDFIKAIGDRAPSSTVQVTFLRNGKAMVAKAVLGERPTMHEHHRRVERAAPIQPRSPSGGDPSLNADRP